ncbi:MAG: DUF2461 domain-containing protein [Flavobacteriales bacterium]
MKYFSNDFITFFKDLARNNASEWFNENRARYETSVKKPFASFIETVINQVQKADKSVKIKASDAIFRINRDIRFSKDKSPYKIHMAAIVSKYGRKAKDYPGMYIMLSPEKIMIGGGVYELEKPALEKVRKSIAKNTAEFTGIVSTATFKKKFGSVRGEKNKIIPPAFKKVAEKQPLIANKSFYVMAELPAKNITSDKLVQMVLDHYKAAKPFNEFFIKAVGK